MLRLLFAALLCVACATANAATMYVTEFLGVPPVSVYYQAALAPAVANATVAIGGGSLQSPVFGASTRLVRVHCDIICNVNIGGTNPTATTSSMRLAAGQTEYFVVAPGDRAAVIAGT